MGMPVRDDGRTRAATSISRTRNVVIQMIKLLQERAGRDEQAYVIISVAVDLKVTTQWICPMRLSLPSFRRGLS